MLIKSMMDKFFKDEDLKPELSLRIFRLIELLNDNDFLQLSVFQLVSLYNYYLNYHLEEPRLSQNRYEQLNEIMKHLGKSKLFFKEKLEKTEIEKNLKELEQTSDKSNKRKLSKRKMNLNQILERLPHDNNYDGYYDPIIPIDNDEMKTKKEKPKLKLQFSLSVVIVLLSIISITSFIIPFI